MNPESIDIEAVPPPPSDPSRGNGVIVTFYSYKGGVGRSMAMANVAEILANSGYRVVVCDWDLEAPGLERYLVDEASAAEKCKEYPGIIDLLLEYKAAIASPPLNANAADEDPPGEATAGDFQNIGNLRLRRPSSYAQKISWEPGQRKGWIKFLSAGRRDGKWNLKYTEAIRDFAWPDFYDKWAGDAYFEFFRADLTREADFVLIDSRTGVTELGGVCTHHLADAVVLLSAANDLNIEGTKWMAEILAGAGQKEIRAGRPPVAIMPVAARIEQTSESGELQRFEERFIVEFSRYLPATDSSTSIFCNRQAFLKYTEIPYLPLYSYRENVIARLPPDKRLFGRQLYSAYARIATGLAQWASEHRDFKRSEASGPADNNTSAPVTSNPDVIPKGRFFISYAAGNDEAALVLFEGMRRMNLDVWCYPVSQSPHEGREHVMQQIQRAFMESSGCLILVRPEDPPIWLEAELNLSLARRATDPEYRALIVAQGELVSRGLAPLLSRFPSVQLPATPSRCTFDKICAELLPEQPLAIQDGTTNLGGTDITNPRQALFFLGRETEVLTLLGQADSVLVQQRLLIVAGPDGSGKTSLISAGLVPALLRGWIGTNRVQPLVARFNVETGSAYLPRLAQVLAETLNAPGSATPTGSDRDPSRPGRYAQEIESQLATPANRIDFFKKNFSLQRPLALIVDSAENLFAAGTNPADSRESLLDLLDNVLQNSESVFLILGLRSDGLEKFWRSRFGSRRSNSELVYKIPPFGEPGMRRYLSGSARLAGVTFESGLADRLMSDFLRHKASISDVGYVLRKLASHLTDRTLTHKTYNDLGGLGTIFGERARRGLEDLEPQEKDVTRRIVLSLIDVRRRKRKSLTPDDIVRVAELGPKGEDVLRLLHRSGIITMDEHGFAGLVHDAILDLALVRHWIDSDLDRLETRDDLEAAADEWEKAGRTGDWLPSKVEIARYRNVSSPSALAEAFLKAGAKRQRSARLTAWATLSLAMVTAGCGLVYALVTTQRERMVARDLETTRLLSQQLSDQVNSLSSTNSDLSQKAADAAQFRVAFDNLTRERAELTNQIAVLTATNSQFYLKLADAARLEENLNHLRENSSALTNQIIQLNAALVQQKQITYGIRTNYDWLTTTLGGRKEMHAGDVSDLQKEALTRRIQWSESQSMGYPMPDTAPAPYVSILNTNY